MRETKERKGKERKGNYFLVVVGRVSIEASSTVATKSHIENNVGGIHFCMLVLFNTK